MLMAALIVGLGMNITSCKSDDDDKQAAPVNISQELLTHGIETDMQSAVIEVPVTCEGTWSACVDGDVEWVGLGDREVVYNGSRTLTLYFDENHTGSDRRSTLFLIDSEGKISEVPLCQYYNFEGEPPTNGSGLAFSNQGVGCGIDYDYVLDTKSIRQRCALEDAKIQNGQMTEQDRTKFDPTKVKKGNNIFNITRIEELISKGLLNKSAYTEATIPFAELEATMLDSTLIQDKSVELTLTIGVSFGIIEFTAEVGYSAKKKEGKAHVDYTIVRNAPMYNVVLSEAEISSYADDNLMEEKTEFDVGMAKIEEKIQKYYKINGKEELTATQQKTINGLKNKLQLPTFGGVFSEFFAKKYWALYSAIAEGDNKAADAVLNSIDNSFGPFFISGGNFGGCLTMHCQVDTMRLEGSDHVSGDLHGEVSGKFRVSGTFDYKSVGFDVMHDSKTKFYLYGGSATKTADELWAITMSDDPDDRKEWQNTLKRWVESMYSSDNEPKQSEAAPISFSVQPIWLLFFDDEMQAYAQEYFIKKYADRGIKTYLGIMDGTNPKTVEEILNEQ
jgi:hypothetical protein